MRSPNHLNLRIWPHVRPIRSVVALISGLLPAALAQAAYALNLPPPASALAQDIYDLHSTILWICIAIFVVVLSRCSWR